jgi:formylglycine-generating enzyme required for sulfatase activity
MKIVRLLFILLPTVLFSQIPNCVPVRADYLWMSKTEVSNAEYTLFLSQIAWEDSLENATNSLLWSERKFTAPLQKYYFRHPAYRNYPVVNITFEQASQYCSWLTDVLNKNYPKQKVRV